MTTSDSPTTTGILKPCPFCGRASIHMNRHQSGRLKYFVYCEGCHVGTTRYGSEETARAAWNTRDDRTPSGGNTNIDWDASWIPDSWR